MNPDYQLMLWAWLGVAAWVGFVILSNRKIHPKALFILFMVELWERFSYYGMRALLILYMTAKIMDGGFALTDAEAYGIYGAYGALVYLTPLIGGYFADKLIGFRRAITIGAILMAIGQFTLFMNNDVTFYIGLAILVVGNGFFKPNISSMVGRFYADGDKRRDGAFTLFYMGINMGAFLAPLTCGAIGENEGWQYGFLTAGIGMLIGYLVFLFGQKSGAYEDIGVEADMKIEKNLVSFIPNNILPYVASLVMIVLATALIKYNDVVDVMLVILASGVIGFLLWQANQMEKEAKQRIWVIVILLLFTTIFWTFFELAGSALSLFTARNVDRTLFGFEINTTFFQSFNPLFIMAFAPIFSYLWIKLANANKEPAAPYKFGFGLVLLGFGFLALQLGGASASAGLVPAIFMVFLYLLHTIGELALSPVGLSLVTKLSPKQMVGFMMGIWFLSSSIAHQGGKHIAKFTTVNEKTIVESDAFQNSDLDSNFITMLGEEKYLGMLEDGSVENVLVDSSFVEDLKKLSNKNYFISNITVQSSLDEAAKFSGFKQKNMMKSATVSFLTTDKEYNDTVASMSELNEIMKDSPGIEVANVIKNESLNKGLSVFGLLGWVAVGCGMLLFVMGGTIKRWMHGIN